MKASRWWDVTQQWGQQALVGFARQHAPHPSGRPSQSLGLGVLAVVLLGIVNWGLLLAIAVGILSMVWVSRIQTQNLQLLAAVRQALLQQVSHQKLTLAIGGAATFSTYLAAAIWQGSHQPGIAIAVMGQGLGIVGVLLLLAEQRSSQIQSPEISCDCLLSHLTSTDSLKRLLAVRQLGQQFEQAQLNAIQTQILGESLRLMLRQEPEAIVRNAILDELQFLVDSGWLEPCPMPLAVQAVSPLERQPQLAAAPSWHSEPSSSGSVF